MSHAHGKNRCFPLLILLNSRGNEGKKCQRRYSNTAPAVEGIRCVPFANEHSFLIISKTNKEKKAFSANENKILGRKRLKLSLHNRGM